MAEYKPNRKIPCVYMRGGTSKAVFFKNTDLPEDSAHREKIILSAFGSPDGRQIDGMGGANTSTSKCAVIGKSTRPGIDVDYDFYQVDIFSPTVDKKMNCGNISSAVGPYAVDEGFVEAIEPFTKVHIYNTNTDKEIISIVPVKDGRAMTEGDYSIDGVPGTGAKILLKFVSPQGAASGKVLPTGRPKDTIKYNEKEYEYSLVDSSNPLVFVRPEEFGIKGTELPSEFNALPQCKDICETLEYIRCTCAVTLGLASDINDAHENSKALPRMVFVSNPSEYTAGSGKKIMPDDIDLVGRLFSLNMKMVDAYMGTGSICTITAANIPGTIINELINGTNAPFKPVYSLKIGHPWGIMEVSADLKQLSDGSFEVLSGNLGRTARRIMDGMVYVRD